MMEDHKYLKNAREEMRSMESSLGTVSSLLETEQSKTDRLEQDVKNYREREKHMEKVKLLQMKRPWLVCSRAS